MTERYIAEDNKVLTRVSLKFDSKKEYTVESLYSDESTIELAMTCIEAYAAEYGMTKDDVGEEVKRVLKGGKKLFNGIFPHDSKFQFIFEQYGKRNVVSEDLGFDIIGTLIYALRSCAVLTTWHLDTVNDFLKEYVEDITDTNFDDEDCEGADFDEEETDAEDTDAEPEEPTKENKE